jgi:cysteinyl-tRNA synthetase
VEFSHEALEEAAAGFARVEHFLARAAERLGEVPAPGELPEAFATALDDDLGTPAAVAVLHETVRAGNKLLSAGDPGPLRAHGAAVRRMLDVLGLDPYDPHWASASSDRDGRLTAAVDALVGALLEQRSAARAAKDFATADAIRDRLKSAGIELEDTPEGPKWSL